MKKISFLLTYIIFILSFSIGLLAILGFSETFSRLLIDGLILFLFFLSIAKISKEKKIYAPFILILSILFLEVFFSFLFNDVETTQLIIFLRKVFIYLLFFYSIINLELTFSHIKKLISLIKILFIIQIIATFVKLTMIGTMEPYIGTIGILGGSLATTIPLMAISYLISEYLLEKRKSSLLYIPFFILIGLASLKIAIIFYFIILFYSLLFITSYKSNNKFLDIRKLIKYFFIISSISVIILMLFISLNPRLNPENKIGGSINIEHVEKYIDVYNNADSLSYAKSTGVKGQGRSDAPAAVSNLLINHGLDKLFLGLGPGDIIKSSFISYKNPLLDKYKIGYGGRIGYLWLAMQIGFVGSIIFLLFHLKLIYHMKKDCRLYSLDKYQLTMYGFSILFFLDVLTYSHVFINEHSVVLVYFFGFAIINRIKNKS